MLIIHVVYSFRSERRSEAAVQNDLNVCDTYSNGCGFIEAALPSFPKKKKNASEGNH